MVMVHNIKLLKSIMKVNFAQLATYRVEFWLNLFDSCVWFAVTLFFFKYIYATAARVPGVKLNQIYLIIATSEIIKSILFTFCLNNLAALPTIVRDGSIDGFLLKPINSQILVSFRKISFGNMGNLLPALLLLLSNIGNISVMRVLSYLCLIIFSCILAYSLWFLLMTCSIWLVRVQDLHEMFLGLLTLNQFPIRVFKTGYTLIYYLLLPIIITSNFPTEVLVLNNLNIFRLGAFVVLTIGTLLISNLFWKFGLKHYTSVSS